jgi:type I restriction enzyme R subunit
MNETYSRVVIDRKLREAGWDIEDQNQVVFEDHGNAGRADYILKDKNGKPLALIEAKSPNIDPYIAKKQALDYVESQYKNQINFIFLANDHITYLWDLSNGGDATPVPAFFTQDDLLRKIYQVKSKTAESLTEKTVDLDYFKDIDPDFKVRECHLEAWKAISANYEKGKRSFLLEMATGTGKTVLTSLIISKFLRTNNAQTVLFVVDRLELAGQTKGTFEKLLGNLSAIATFWGGSKKNLLGANVVIATIQSLMLHGKDVFSPGYFDLIIHDEAHRSIYTPEARAALDQFIGATKIGLTATPRDFLKNIDIEKLQIDDPRAVEARIQRDTYRYFGCEDRKATYRFTLQDGVKAGFLVPPRLHKMTSLITQEALSDEGLVVEGDFENQSYKITDLEKKVISPERNRLMMQEFLEYADKNPDGEIGKTIIFAVSQRHAIELEKILNELKPEFNGKFAQTITSQVKDAHDLARDFKHLDKKLPRLVVSVDMLTTGYDAPEVQNIVLARPIFEPTLYQQIKGRGTRVCPEIHKTHFTVFDFCGVCAYFEEKYDWEAPLAAPTGSISKAASMYPMPTPQSQGIPASDGNPSTITSGPFILTRADIVNSRDLIEIGPEGDKVDREMYQENWVNTAHEYFSKHPELNTLLDDDKIDELINRINMDLLNKPEDYFSEESLTKSHRIIASVSDFFFAAIKKKELPTREQQLAEWEQGLIEKYGTDTNKPSQKKYLMVKLFSEEILKNSQLRDSLINKPQIDFLQEHPFNAYSVQDWINTFGKEQLKNMVYDVQNSMLLKI